MASNELEPTTPSLDGAQASGKKPYSRPTILSRQRLEAVATNCGKIPEDPGNPLCDPDVGGTLIS